MGIAIQLLARRPSASLTQLALALTSVAVVYLIVVQIIGRGVSQLDAGLIYVLFTLLVAVNFGLKPGLIAGVVSTVLVNYFFLDPIFGFALSQPQHVLSLPVFLLVPIVGASQAAVVQARQQTLSCREQAPAGGGIEIDPETRQVLVDGQRVRLTPTELRLLEYLATRPDRVLRSQEILQDVWGEAYAEDARILRTYINQLRSKLGDSHAEPRFIGTEPGFGYRFLGQSAR